jgi:hypothetical protein
MAAARAVIIGCGPLPSLTTSSLARRHEVARGGHGHQSMSSSKTSNVMGNNVIGKKLGQKIGRRSRGTLAIRASWLDDIGLSGIDVSGASSGPVPAAAVKGYADLFPNLPSQVLGVSVPDAARSIADAAAPAASKALAALPDATQVGGCTAVECS